VNDKAYLNQKLQEELLKRNTQLAALESRLKEREDDLTKWELADKVRRQEAELEGGERISKREYDRIERQLQQRDRELAQMRDQVEDL
jgi:hypothetical protein